MGFSPQDFQDPVKLFEVRTRQTRVRIQTLQQDLLNVQSLFAKTIIEDEINMLIDDYVERKSVLQRETSSD